MNSTSRRLRLSIALLLALLLAASACTREVSGTAVHAQGGVKKDAEPSDLTIENTDGSEIDQLVANSMADIMKYWDKVADDVFGEELPPLKGGVHAYEPDDPDPIPCFSESEKEYAANNAFYCPSEDAIAYHRSFIAQMVDEFGEFIVPLVFAHEYGHAMQDRVGLPSQKPISWEGQADCYAGAFTNAAVDGTDHFQATSADLDSVLGGYLLLRDQPGYSADDEMAHGSAFDRVGAFQEGFNDGGGHCFDSFGEDREYTEIPYLTSNDKANQGNMPYEAMVAVIPDEMNKFGAAITDDWTDVTASGFDGSSAKCDGDPQSEMVFYCPSDETVHYAEQELMQQAYDTFGDLAGFSIVGLGYADAILEQTSTDKDPKDAFVARLCLIGAHAGGAFEAAVNKEPSPLGELQLSAGDLDESVMLLIALGEDDEFIDTHGMDAFERINVFRESVQAAREDPVATAEGCLD